MVANIWWTKEEETILRKLVEAGHDEEAIQGVLCSRTANAIRGKMAELGLKSPNMKPQIDYDKLNLLVNV